MCLQSWTKQKTIDKVIVKKYFVDFKDRCELEQIFIATIRGSSVREGVRENCSL